MELKRRNQSSLILWATVAALISQNLVIPVISAAAPTVEGQKNYYPRDPGAGTGTPPTPSGSTGGSSPPSSGGGGHGGHGGTPSANCGNPPSGGHSTPTPSAPSGGGGYHRSPPSTPTPNTPTTPTTPTPSTPFVPTPFFTPPTPSSPIDPGTPSVPGITIPSPPFPFDPNSPPFTCDFWRNHPTLIWGVLGWLGTVGGTLGATSIPGFGSSMSVLDALGNSRTDGYGALYREGTAAYLNAMVSRGRRFPYTTNQVRDRFASSLKSNKAAANQARLFKLANEGRVKV